MKFSATRVFCTILCAGYMSAALAVGDEDPLPPKPTETSTQCSDTEIFDTETKTCVPAQDSRFDDDTRYEALRELAYFGETDPAAYKRAFGVLEAMSDPSQPRVQTYMGFLKRKTGHPKEAMAHYAKALEADPNNLLTRSYLGEAYLVQGDRVAAERQLREIRARGGIDSWPEAYLVRTLSGGALGGY